MADVDGDEDRGGVTDEVETKDGERPLDKDEETAPSSAPSSKRSFITRSSSSSSSSPSPASLSVLKGPRVELRKWTAVALWSWDIEVDTCAICRNLIMELCIECQANQRGAAAAATDCTVPCLPLSV
jgi:hypothetical protein